MHWVASLFLSCLGVGWSIGEAVAGMMGQTGIPLDAERTVVRDYGFSETLRWLSFAPFGSGAWWGWVVALLMWLVCCWVGPLAQCPSLRDCLQVPMRSRAASAAPCGFLWGL